MPELTLKDLKAGAECWAWQYDWPKALSLPMASMKPVRGILAEHPDRVGDTSRAPGWFVPYSGRSRKPAFTKSVRVEAVNICSDKDDAQDDYNRAVRAVAARFLDLAKMAQSDIVPLERDGFSEKDGTLDDYPVLRPDLTLDYAGILAAINPCLELNPDHGGKIYPWLDFLRIERQGGFTVHDGCGDLVIDGKGSEHTLLDLARGLVYVPDSYAVPFEKVGDVLRGHEIQVIWFNK